MARARKESPFDATRVGPNDEPPLEARAPIVVATIMRKVGATGVQTHIREFCESLGASGNPPLLITPYSWGGALSIPVFGVRRLLLEPVSGAASVAWYRYWHFVFLRRALKRELSRLGSVVVYAQCPLSALAALEARREPSQRVVVAVHFADSQAEEWVGMGRLRRGDRVYRNIVELERRVLPLVDGIVYVSASARRGVASHVNGVEHVRSAVIPNFVGDPRMSPSLDPSRTVNSNPADLIAVGGLLIPKNQQFLLAVIHAAKQMGHRLTIDIVGDGPCRHQLERLAHSLGVEDQVRFLGLRLDARKLFVGHRVLVHAATRESFGIVLIEAMGSGLPVVTSDAGGMAEVFEPGVEGLVWALDDPRAAARMLVDLLEDEATVTRMGEAARARFERSFDASVIAPQLEQFLLSTQQRWIGNRPAPDPG